MIPAGSAKFILISRAGPARVRLRRQPVRRALTAMPPPLKSRRECRRVSSLMGVVEKAPDIRLLQHYRSDSEVRRGNRDFRSSPNKQTFLRPAVTSEKCPKMGKSRKSNKP
jgi:hypothetical protein